MSISAKRTLKYVLMPQIFPRIQGLFFSGFSYIAFFVAQTYRSVQLLPAGHPYLNPANVGRFGIRHVIAEAGNNLVFRKENIDQIALYFMILFGMILLFAQVGMLMCSAFLETGYASNLYGSSRPQDFFSYFQTPVAMHDLAFVMLDRVFGIPSGAGTGTSFFSDANGGYTCVVELVPCFDLQQSTRELHPDRIIRNTYNGNGGTMIPFPWPFHDALRAMLQVYSVGLLVIAVIIFLYFMFAVAAETAQTGTAFGRRFNHLWAPIRMVVAMGLLIPIAHGLNPAQWILMYAAKWGSSFATNGWIIYNTAATKDQTLLGNQNTLIATPSPPPVNTLMEFASVLATCKLAYERLYTRVGRPPIDIKAWIVNPTLTSMVPRDLAATDFAAAVEFANRGTIIVRFGDIREQDTGGGNQTYDSKVPPHCGEVELQLPYVPEDLSGGGTEPGSWLMEEAYYNLIKAIWQDAATGTPGGSQSWWQWLWNGSNISFKEIGQAMADRHIAVFNNKDTALPTAEQLNNLRISYEDSVRENLTKAVQAQQGSTEWTEQLTQLGWGGAAIWYNKIAQLNGGMVSAVYSMPTVKKYPKVMEEVQRERASGDSSVSGETRFRVYHGADSPIDMEDTEEEQMAKAMFQAQALWRDNSSVMQKEGNIYLDAINSIFGTEGLFNITTNEAQNIHPLAQLSSIGRSIVDSAIRNLGYSAASGLGGGILNIFQQSLFGRVAGAGSSFLIQVAMIGLAIGFVLFYVVPFLPFIYFFFAVGGWIKGIFEAMVGVPLWALAHIRIDGDGLPGDAAMGGYYLILEIFIRPILIIFGFVASITIFTAQVQVLHEVWSLVVSNVSGFQQSAAAAANPGTSGSIEFMRGVVDKFFFTIIYAIMCYMLAMGSFKLIDQIPNHILRWMGANVSTFGDQSGDPAQNLIRNSYMGANMATSKVSGAISGVGSGMSGAPDAMTQLSMRAGK